MKLVSSRKRRMTRCLERGEVRCHEMHGEQGYKAKEDEGSNNMSRGRLVSLVYGVCYL